MSGFSSFPPKVDPQTTPTVDVSGNAEQVVEIGKAIINANDPALNVTPPAGPLDKEGQSGTVTI